MKTEHLTADQITARAQEYLERVRTRPEQYKLTQEDAHAFASDGEAVMSELTSLMPGQTFDLTKWLEDQDRDTEAQARLMVFIVFAGRNSGTGRAEFVHSFLGELTEEQILNMATSEDPVYHMGVRLSWTALRVRYHRHYLH